MQRLLLKRLRETLSLKQFKLLNFLYIFCSDMTRHLCKVTGLIFCVKKAKEVTTYLIGKSSYIKMVYDVHRQG